MGEEEKEGKEEGEKEVREKEVGEEGKEDEGENMVQVAIVERKEGSLR